MNGQSKKWYYPILSDSLRTSLYNTKNQFVYY